MGTFQVKQKQKNKYNQLSTIESWIYTHHFQKNIRNLFDMLNFIDRDWEEMWNENRVAVKDEFEKRLPRTQKQKKPNEMPTLDSEICQKDRRFRKKELQRVVRRVKKQYYNDNL